MLSTAKVIASLHAMRVADAAVERVRAILGEADDVGPRLDARQLAQAARRCPVPSRTTRHPRRHPGVEPLLEQREGHRAGGDEEDEDPDRPVVQPIADLVALADLAVRRQLDAARVAVGLFVGGGKNRSGQQETSPRTLTEPQQVRPCRSPPLVERTQQRVDRRPPDRSRGGTPPVTRRWSTRDSRDRAAVAGTPRDRRPARAAAPDAAPAGSRDSAAPAGPPPCPAARDPRPLRRRSSRGPRRPCRGERVDRGRQARRSAVRAHRASCGAATRDTPRFDSPSS